MFLKKLQQNFRLFVKNPEFKDVQVKKDEKVKKNLSIEPEKSWTPVSLTFLTQSIIFYYNNYRAYFCYFKCKSNF